MDQSLLLMKGHSRVSICPMFLANYLSRDTKHSPILPHDSNLSRLFVYHTHLSSRGNRGLSELASNLPDEVWCGWSHCADSCIFSDRGHPGAHYGSRAAQRSREVSMPLPVPSSNSLSILATLFLEYLNHFQEWGKWREATENFACGQLVLVQDDRYPPCKWPLAKILETHPGSDGRVRVVTVKTTTMILKRHIARKCPLSRWLQCVNNIVIEATLTFRPRLR